MELTQENIVNIEKLSAVLKEAYSAGKDIVIPSGMMLDVLERLSSFDFYEPDEDERYQTGYDDGYEDGGGNEPEIDEDVLREEGYDYGFKDGKLRGYDLGYEDGQKGKPHRCE